jgi:hypothetical protein
MDVFESDFQYQFDIIRIIRQKSDISDVIRIRKN